MNDELTKIIKKLIREEVRDTFMASKSFVYEQFNKTSGEIVAERIRAERKEHSQEKQIKKLFAKTDKLEQRLNSKQEEFPRPRPGQLCYTWDYFMDYKAGSHFKEFNDCNQFIDTEDCPWDHWSFIPEEDIK